MPTVTDVQVLDFLCVPEDVTLQKQNTFSVNLKNKNSLPHNYKTNSGIAQNFHILVICTISHQQAENLLSDTQLCKQLRLKCMA